MADRRLVENKSGLRVLVDIDRDMDEATFDAMVKRGDLRPVDDKPVKKAAAKQSK
jgi:hypothetical protein